MKYSYDIWYVVKNLGKKLFVVSDINYLSIY